MEYHCQSKACRKLFNQTTREPMLLVCCGESICRTCSDTLISPQEEKYNCPCCKSQNLSAMKPIANMALKRMIQKLSQVNIRCEEHEDQQAEFYCQTHKQMICTNCAFKIHGNHNDQCVELNCKEFDVFCHTLLVKLKDENLRISEMIESLTSYLESERVLKSKDFLKLITEASEVVVPKINDEKEENILGYLADNKKIMDLNEENILGNIAENQIIKDMIKIIPIDSKIMNVDADLPLIKGWLGNMPNLKFELLFRGSRDGFTAAAFHQRCDNQGPTLHIVLSEHNKVFGGYAFVSWRSLTDNQSAQDEKAFLFSITHKTKHKQYQRKEYAVRHYQDSLSMFGYGADLRIRDNCNLNKDSYSDLGCTYEPPNGYKEGSDETNNYLAGSYQFRVDEIEVFKVITQ